MPFCPSCRSEYRDGFARCSDCGTELVAALAPPANPAAPEYALLLTSADPDLVPVVVSALEAAAIPYLAEGAEAAGLLPLGPGGPAPHSGLAVEIHVPADRLEEARALLDLGAIPAEELPPELAGGGD
jgi:hypothetical protein